MLLHAQEGFENQKQSLNMLHHMKLEEMEHGEDTEKAEKPETVSQAPVEQKHQMKHQPQPSERQEEPSPQVCLQQTRVSSYRVICPFCAGILFIGIFSSEA